ncbi:MAG: hypothetical protein HS113_06120 [Verrucomicrobiales bacterium]|nr:hypothetical protein [Verrucomicrobiales bacterium]
MFDPIVFCTFLQQLQRDWASCGCFHFDDPQDAIEELESVQREVQNALAAARANRQPKVL